ncbi:MAG: GNAT family protein [Myxococcota bacterium]
MKLAIQRRSIYLEPPRGMDVIWVTRQLSHPEIAENFAWGDDLTPADICGGHRIGAVIVGMMRRVVDGARMGFVLMLCPHEGKDFWEILAAIPDVRHRDAFSMMHAIDAMSHYMFDHLGAPRCGATVKPENAASLAVVRRIGYRQREIRPDSDGVPHAVYVLDPEAWAQRRARLERGETEHPSGAGAAFVVLPGPPYTPVRA